MTHSVSRRTLAKGTAWSVPAVAVATASPAVAASPPCTPCSDDKNPDATFIDNGTACSSAYLQMKPSLVNNCPDVVLPAGYVVQVSLTNNGSEAGQYKSNYSDSYTTSGPTSYTTVGAGQTVTWTYTTTAAVPGGSSLGMFAEMTNGDWVGTWQIIQVPAGYTDNPDNNSITIDSNA